MMELILIGLIMYFIGFKMGRRERKKKEVI